MKELVFFTGSALVVPLGVVAGSMSRLVRTALFFGVILGTTVTERLDINLISREWYRGTTRGFEVSFVDLLVWMLLGSALVSRLSRRRAIRWPAALMPLLAYFGYCLMSLGYCEPKLFGAFEVMKIGRSILVFLAVFLFVESRRELRLLLIALACTMGIEGFSALKERYMLGVHRVRGTLAHPNSLSMFCCMVAPILTAALMSTERVRVRILLTGGLLLAVGCVVLTISRTGFVTLGLVLFGTVAACTAGRLSLRHVAIGVVVLVASAGVAWKSWDTLKERFGESSLADEYFGEVTEGRGVYLRLAKNIVADHPLGIGLNNWSYAVSNTYGPAIGMHYVPYSGTEDSPDQEIPYASGLDAAQAAPAHNLMALTVGELGWPGAMLLMLIWIRSLMVGAAFLLRRSPDIVSRFGLGAFFGILAAILQSVTEWELRQTQILFLYNVVLGGLVAAAVIWRQEKHARSRAMRARRIAPAAPPATVAAPASLT